MIRLMSTFGRSRYPNYYRRSARRLLTTQLFCNLTLPPVERYARADGPWPRSFSQARSFREIAVNLGMNLRFAKIL